MIIQAVQDVLGFTNEQMAELLDIHVNNLKYRKKKPEMITTSQLKLMARALKRFKTDTGEIFTITSTEGESRYTLRQFVDYLQEDFPYVGLRVIENNDST